MFGEEGKREGEETKAFENVWGRKSVPPPSRSLFLKEYWAVRWRSFSLSLGEIRSGADEQRFKILTDFDLLFFVLRGDGDGCGGLILRDIIAAGDLEVCDIQYII
jgi:hypothetical protein